MQATLFPSTSIYNTLIYAYGQTGDLAACSRLVAEMDSKGIPRDASTYCVLIEAHARAGDFMRAQEVLREMKDAGFLMDDSAHSILVGISIRSGQLTLAMQLLDEMRGLGMHPPTLLLGNAIEKFCEAGYLAECMKLLEDSVTVERSPPILAYTSILELCFKRHNKEALSEVLDNMKRFNIPPVVAYIGLMDKWEHQGDIKGGLEVAHDLQSRGESPNELFFTRLMRLYEKAGDYSRCIKVLDDGAAMGVLPNFSNVLFHTYAQKGETAVCARLIGYARSKGRRLDAAIYERMIELWVKRGELQMAMKMLEEDMVRAGLIPGLDTYTLLIDGWSRKGALGASTCMRLFTEMKKFGHTPLPSTYDHILMAYGRKKEISACMKIWEEMKAKNYTARDPAYNTVIVACTTAGDMAKAMRFLQEMKDNGLKPTESTYCTLITTNGKKGDLGTVAKLFEEAVKTKMEGEGLYSALVGAYGAQGCLLQGRGGSMSLVDLLRKLGKNNMAQKIQEIGLKIT